jgi:hypothetical protein
MKSRRALERQLRAVALRVIRDDKKGKDADPADLVEMREVVDQIIEKIKKEGGTNG